MDRIQDIIALMERFGCRVECKTLEERRVVLLKLRDAGMKLTAPAERHLSLHDVNFEYPSVGISDNWVDCWISCGDDRVITFNEFLDAISEDEFVVVDSDEMFSLYLQ